MNDIIDSENQKNDDFLSALESNSANVQPINSNIENPKSTEEINQNERNSLQAQLNEKKYEEKSTKKASSKKKKEVSMEDVQATSTEEVDVTPPLVEESVEPEPSKEVPVEEKKSEPEPEKPVKKHKNSKTVEVQTVTPEEAITIEHNKTEKTKSNKKIKQSVEIVDDFDKKINENNAPDYMDDDPFEEEEAAPNLDIETINKTIDESYEDKKVVKQDDESYDVEIVSDKNETKQKEISKSYDYKVKRKNEHRYFGGPNDENISFKLRSAKISKILRNMNIDDTTTIESADITGKTTQERQDIYLKTVLPTLQPSMSVVPFILSGVVITMSAFTWPDIQELLKIEDKVDELDPNNDTYFYEKNKLFIEKRRKQLDLFYKHITTVSGYEVKPSQDDLFRKIIKEPDFSQLFFAAYSASFLKEYQFDITCATCGTTNEKMVNSKDLCFLLNSNINVKQLNHYIETGGTIDVSESAKIYKEFQEEKIVELANSTYRTKRKLPVSSFIYDLKIPTIYEALDSMEEMIELFKDKDLSYTDMETGNTVYIDSSFGLPANLIEMKKYLYIDNLIVPRIINEDKETNKAQVSFVNFKEKSAIINSIYSLSPEDYRTLINDENLNKLIRVSGIRHAIDAGICKEVTCKSELGSIPVEPEMLFFIIARQEYV
jgi:hypothetical protein